MKKKVAVLQNAKSYFEKKTGMYAKPELQTFLDELRVLVSFMEEQVQKAPATVNVKRPGDRPRPQIYVRAPSATVLAKPQGTSFAVPRKQRLCIETRCPVLAGTAIFNTCKAANCVVSQKQGLPVEICFFRLYRDDFSSTYKSKLMAF